MSILGRVITGTVSVIADGFDYVITKSASKIENKFGENELIQTVSEIGSSTIRVTESTVKTLADAVDGGIDAGIGCLAKDENKKVNGIKRVKSATREMVTGVGKGIEYTVEKGANTTASAARAGKYYIQGNEKLAGEEIAKTKVLAKDLAKVLVIGLLAFGVMDPGGKDKNKEKD